MRHLTPLDRALTPDGSELVLYQAGADYLIRAGGRDLMSSRTHGSEQAMARIARTAATQARVLIGGLGMGWTLRAALEVLPEGGRITVVELVPEVVRWNEGPMGDPSGHPIRDPRVEVQIGDVAATLSAASATWDAVLLDVDNGPEAFTQPANDRIYSVEGLRRARRTVKPGGRLAVWSAFDVVDFPRRLKLAGFTPEIHKVRAHDGKGARHVIYVGVNLQVHAKS